MSVTAMELLRTGGRWLGAMRDRIKWMRCGGNGCSVTWGSDDVIDPPLTIREVEELAAEAVAADRNDRARVSPERVGELRAAITNLELSAVEPVDQDRYSKAYATVDRLLAQLAGESPP